MSHYGSYLDPNHALEARPFSEAERKRSRRRCLCGARLTHRGFANDVALMSGCEWCVRKWVQEGYRMFEVKR